MAAPSPSSRIVRTNLILLRSQNLLETGCKLLSGCQFSAAASATACEAVEQHLTDRLDQIAFHFLE